MNKIFTTLLVASSVLLWQGCSDDDSGTSPKQEEPTSSSTEKPQSSSIEEEEDPADDSSLPNYSRAIEINKALGHGINFGNSWDSGVDPKNACKDGKETNWCYTEGKVYDYLDDNWSNPIQDSWFQIVKDAGFQSIRLPVRWNQTALSTPPYTIQAARVEGVKRHVKMANDLGMLVIINQHHFNELYVDPEGQKEKFYAIWEQIAEEFKDFSNDSLVFEVLNESRDASDKVLNELTKQAIAIIRKTNPGRTIMINPGNWGKFELMTEFADIKDSNIIIDGHYYEPYSYSHQGHSSKCSVTWTSTNQALLSIVSDLKGYVNLAKKTFPGKNGTYVPLNMGEFGASSACEDVTDEANRAEYIKAVVQAANQLGISWEIWGFTGVQFDIYDKTFKEWYPTILQVLQDNMK